MRRSKQLHLDPGKDGLDGLERFRHTSFELNSPLLLEIATQHPQDPPWETEVRRLGPHHTQED